MHIIGNMLGSRSPLTAHQVKMASSVQPTFDNVSLSDLSPGMLKLCVAVLRQTSHDLANGPKGAFESAVKWSFLAGDEDVIQEWTLDWVCKSLGLTAEKTRTTLRAFIPASRMAKARKILEAYV